MKIRAIVATGEKLSEVFLRIGWTHQSMFHLTVDREYDVLGICLTREALQYLVWDDVERPQWYPVSAFVVTDDTLSPEWHFHIFPPYSNVTAVWGYRELSDEDHFDGLAERDPGALQVFRERALEARRLDDAGLNPPV